MKNLVLFSFLLSAFLGHSQLSISTDFRQDAVWLPESESWDINSTDEGGTLFEFNNELTQFKHTTETITSNYYISDWKYDEENLLYTMTVTSDVGNEYEVLIDGINNCVCFFYWRDEQYILVRHTIKSSWYNE